MPIQRAIALWPIDRSVDRAKPHSRPFGRSAQVAGQRAHSCVRRSTVDRPGRPPEPGRAALGIRKLGFYLSNKSHKISENPQK